MLATLLQNLTADQRRQLVDLEIPKQRVTDLVKGRILPTEVQVIALAAACSVDRHALQDEVALLRATPEQRTMLERVMGKAKAGLSGATAAVLAGLLVFAASAGAGMADDTRFAARLRRR